MSTLIALHNISKTYDHTPILSAISFSLTAGDRVGLVGANGAGKSTLLKIIAGELAPDGGDLRLSATTQIGYLPQIMRDQGGRTVSTLLYDSAAGLRALEAELRALEQQMTSAQGDELTAVLDAYGAATETFERRGGYEIDTRIDQVLAGLQLTHLDPARAFESLSGGEKARVGLAALLLSTPDLLLLDEPTNHLDFASLSWLASYLASYRGAALIASHDRHLLDHTVNAIIEVDEFTRQIKRYVGDYTHYHAARQRERARWQTDYLAQQDEIKALRRAIKDTAHRNNNYRAHTDNDKFIRNDKIATHDSTVARRITAAEAQLARILDHPIPKPPQPLRFNSTFDADALHGRLVITASDVSKHYGDRAILDRISFAIDARARIALVSENGAGKSTLLRLLVGIEPPDDGTIMISPSVKIGYLDQEQRDLDPDLTLFAAYRASLDDEDQPLKARVLELGLFRYTDLDLRVGALSIGQRRKLQLARLIAARANLLILDEPTNHVSFDVLEAFESALRDFPGAVIAATHDRRFIDTFGGDVWLLHNGSLTLDGHAAYVNVAP